MMRLLIRFLLSLAFLLAAGHKSQIKDHTCCRPESKPLISKAAPSSTRNQWERIKAVEIEEDDEPEHFRKNADSHKYYFSLFYTQVSYYFFNYPWRRLPFCEHFSYFSSSKFIIHRVIRI